MSAVVPALMPVGSQSADIKSYGIEGPGWMVREFDGWWANPVHRVMLMKIARAVEREPSLVGVSAHIMVVASKS
jgi:hypothetical protein